MQELHKGEIEGRQEQPACLSHKRQSSQTTIMPNGGNLQQDPSN